MEKNAWLQLNKNTINNVLNKLEEDRFKSAYQGQLDVRSVIYLFNGMISEIKRLQKENDGLKNKQGPVNESSV